MLESKILNMKLAEKQGLTQEDVRGLEILHSFKDNLFQTASVMSIKSEHGTPLDKKGIVLALEQIEFSMQRLWKFTEDRNFHTWWYQIPGCQCPVSDNRDNFGTEYRVTHYDCPFHGTRGSNA